MIRNVATNTDRVLLELPGCMHGWWMGEGVRGERVAGWRVGLRFGDV